MSTYHNAGSSSRVTPDWAQVEHQEEMDDLEDEGNRYRDMPLDHILEDLIAKFMIDISNTKLTAVRLYWQAEEAHWYYDDYVRQYQPTLPSLSQRRFSQLIIDSSPLFANVTDEDGKPINHDKLWNAYTKYKRMVPTCGVALINAKESKTLLVRHFKSTAWSWPRGKINENEAEDDCAVRELEEETGYDCSREIDPNAKCQAFINGQSSTMFFVTGVDESFPFAARTRNEIEETRWVKLQDLPTWRRKASKKGEQPLVFFKVAPFVDALKKYLHDPNRKDRSRPKNLQNAVRNDAAAPSAITVRSQPSTSSYPLDLDAPVTGLDKLFVNAMYDKTAGLSGGPGGDQDNRDGLERLFGNISVSTSEQASKEAREDDALARLLGAIGTSATPAPTFQNQQLDSGKSILLSLLNQKTPSAPPRQQASPPQHDSETPKPHSAKLLAMFASPAPVATKPPMPAPMQANQHVSLPTTPRPASPPADERINKQRALLDLTLAGLSLDTSSAQQANHAQSLYGTEYGNTSFNQSNTYHEPPRNSPPQPQVQAQHQYRPPPPPAAFPPPSGAYYSSNAAQPPPTHHTGPSYPNGPGPSPPRNRGAPPPPYESHYGAPGPVRPMPPVVPAQPVHEYNPHGQGYYARPQSPIPTQGQSYRPHLPPQPQQQQAYNPGFQQPFVSPQNAYQPSYGAPTGYQAPSHRPPPHQVLGQYQPQHSQQQQQPYIPSVQGHPPNNGANSHHTGPMHQPIPKSGPQHGLLAMLNNR